MTMAATSREAAQMADELTWEPPGGGSWMLDTTHHGRRPVTPLAQSLMGEMVNGGFASMVEKYGLPLAELRFRFVNDCLYVRPVAVGEPENPKGDPPLFVMKLLTRIHPTLRKRNKIAADAWAERRWRSDVDAWFGGEREASIAANLAIQNIDPAALDDPQLSAHLRAAIDNMMRLGGEAGATHGGDIIPVGDFMFHCATWGLDTAEAASLLQGASPASVETERILQPVAAALRTTDGPLTSVDDVRDLGPEVADAVDEWMRLHGHRVLWSDDFDAQTLAERPDLQLAALLGTRLVDVASEVVPDPSPVRERVPRDDRALFDELLSEARYGLRLRDDNVGVRWNWPAGLVRRAALEAGERFIAAGRVREREDALLCDPGELEAMLIGDGGPSLDEIDRRRARRAAVLASEPPLLLGPEGGEPPIEAFPKPLRRATGAMFGLIEAMQGEATVEPLSGVGVGDATYRGRAVIVDDVAEAIGRVEPGDVVVTTMTSPSWNSLLPMIGGLVVEEGGPMCHAAIVSREFGLPAVIGVTDAKRLVPDGAEVTVDPVQGRVVV